jgi:hypothetical protein
VPVAQVLVQAMAILLASKTHRLVGLANESVTIPSGEMLHVAEIGSVKPSLLVIMPEHEPSAFMITVPLDQ